MTSTNIQELFARISLADIRAYLTECGWSVECAEGSETIHFHPPAQLDASELWLWCPESHPKFRRRVPDILFSLSLLENRPALDIANDLYGLGQRSQAARTTKPEASPQPTSTGGDAAPERRETVCWTFTHRGSDTLMLRLVPDGGTHALEPGDRLVAVYRVGELPVSDEPLVDFALADSSAVVTARVTPPQLRFFQEAGLRADRRPPTPRVIVAEELAGLPSSDGRDATADQLAQLAPALERIEFELESDGPPDRRLEDTYRRQAALLAAALVRQLPLTPLARQLVWRVTLRLLAPVQLGLELYGSAVDELYFTAAADAEASPTRTRALLATHTTCRT